jgi:OmpA-OmpF porin, OOP family
MLIKNLCLLILLLASFQVFSQNPFASVNSQYDEQNPVLSPDGRTLYFTRSKHPQNVGGTKDPGDIWYSHINPDSTWSEPINAKILNNMGWNGVLGFVGGSDLIYLLNHYNENGGPVKTQGIARSLKTTSGWSAPTNIEVPYYKNLSEFHGGNITSDASIMILSLESYDSRGGEDIYVCFNQGNSKWSEPKNLGNLINTKFQEFSPFLSADGKTLYFSSNGQSASGGTDIYKTERLDETWRNWSVATPLAQVNTEGKELGLHAYDGFYLYTSTLNSDGYADIRMYKDAEAKEPQVELSLDSTLVMDIVIVEEEPIIDDKLITLFGDVIDKATNELTVAKISLKTPSDSLISSIKSEKGSYALKIEAIGIYLVSVEAPGYMSHQELLELRSNQISNFELNFTLQPITVGTTVNLKDVLFKQSRTEFLESSYPELNLVVEFLKENPNVEIRLEGHTDNRGVAKYNVKLSKERVTAVKKYLVKKGIASKRISGKGHGGSRPIADNDNPDTRIFNRRVEFTIVKN